MGLIFLPLDRKYAYRPSKFCDEIELYETANVHPHLAKLSRYCCDRRLAVVYDEELTTVLSDVLPADDFGWDKRMMWQLNLQICWHGCIKRKLQLAVSLLHAL
ncbi:hypothetical protein RDI58_007260 [Solanum bulbocastanum]|uniref:Uncharacterized protein n=1 Tax=Solanum bulbocastanum TaxID=147425 RepID=A0AAN8U0B5_SOLBU